MNLTAAAKGREGRTPATTIAAKATVTAVCLCFSVIIIWKRIMAGVVLQLARSDDAVREGGGGSAGRKGC